MNDTKTEIQTNGNKGNESAYLGLEKLEKLMRWPPGTSDELFQTLISISPRMQRLMISPAPASLRRR